MEPGVEDFTSDELVMYLRSLFPLEMANKIIAYDLSGKHLQVLVGSANQFAILKEMKLSIKEILEFQVKLPPALTNSETKESTPSKATELDVFLKNMRQKQLRSEVDSRWGRSIPANFSQPDAKKDLNDFMVYLKNDCPHPIIRKTQTDVLKRALLGIVHERRRYGKKPDEEDSDTRRQLNFDKNQPGTSQAAHSQDQNPSKTTGKKGKGCPRPSSKAIDLSVSSPKRTKNYHKLKPLTPKRALGPKKSLTPKKTTKPKKIQRQDQVITSIPETEDIRENPFSQMIQIQDEIVIPETEMLEDKNKSPFEDNEDTNRKKNQDSDNGDDDDDPTQSLSHRDSSYVPSSPNYTPEKEPAQEAANENNNQEVLTASQDQVFNTQAVNTFPKRAAQFLAEDLSEDQLMPKDFFKIAHLICGVVSNAALRRKMKQFKIEIASGSSTPDRYTEFGRELFRRQLVVVTSTSVKTDKDIFKTYTEPDSD
ncbi:uncharacterized protein [Clytia hemisphaerica]|uniref:Uncharacterized protein n=1 Tax=Clytia hemisphaerica TaxID=252671 RepID=A0A7M5XHV4_9CNID